ncbi:CRISPR-associated endonuclease Cas2 [Granulicatella seriolae]|uniref:CRISPR-associated endoribonuclease Cas2 n=1 Tax=Granulicatella seriolae TaxID=2967226 RepID=A0ABT1WP90_9LACT|nr:CRISPR-associated endonuclease Cas2 [Granulicatella seriolae]
MRFEQLRLLCMFDLPMETPREQKDYRIFRKSLLENGFTMMQYSIYYRTLPNRSALKKFEDILKKKVPKNGNIRLIYVTENQFQEMLLLSGNRSRQEAVVGINRLVVI